MINKKQFPKNLFPMLAFFGLLFLTQSSAHQDANEGFPLKEDALTQNIMIQSYDGPQGTSIEHLQKQILAFNEISQTTTDQSTNPQTQQEDLHEQSHYHKPSEPQFWINIIIAITFTITGAFCSGMGVGFCNIDKLQLQVMTMSKDPQEKKMAQTIHQVVSNHHLWLTTLLVYNAVALESLPLVVHTLMPDWMAILFSTVIVLIAAEIVPQAVCTGPKKMIIAYYAAPIVNTMRRALFFIIHPIAKGLDNLLGVHNHQRIQHKDFANFLTGNKILKPTEKILLTSTLELRVQRVLEKMIPIKKLYSLECSQVLTKEKVQDMMKKDYSHVLVYKYSKDQIIGVIKVKELAVKYLRCENKNIKAEQAMDSKTPMLSVYKDTNLLEMLMLFQANSNRIALVCDEKRKTASGIPSIMYTKNDMIMKKKGVKIIGAIFLYQIFDELTNYEEKVPKNSFNSGELMEMKELKQPLIDKGHH